MSGKAPESWGKSRAATAECQWREGGGCKRAGQDRRPATVCTKCTAMTEPPAPSGHLALGAHLQQAVLAGQRCLSHCVSGGNLDTCHLPVTSPQIQVQTGCIYRDSKDQIDHQINQQQMNVLEL